MSAGLGAAYLIRIYRCLTRSPRTMRTQAIRAVLLAIAIAACFGRHAAEQLRDPRSFVRASLRLAHDGGAEIDANIEALPSPPLWKTSLCRSPGC
jgi:hypothetical protein